MTRSDLAEKNFLEGYNCSQSLVLAFSDVVGLDRGTLLKLSSSFGGGVGRLREVCGAVSGMAMVLGLVYGYATPETGSVKAEHYARVQTVSLRFEKEAGSVVCRELLGLDVKHSSPVPSARTSDFYANRPCAKLIRLAASILEDYIESEKIK